mgnify:CR=1 FL=1
MTLLKRYSSAEYSHWRPEEVKIIDDQPVRFSDVCVHEFIMSDTDDPEVYASAPIWEWQQSEAGCWVMEHAITKPYWVQHLNYTTYGYHIKIMARLSDPNHVFWKLKWGT